jgi:hypothetical protein
VTTQYRFQAEVTSASGVPLGALPISPNWGPALEWCRWQGVRRGRSVLAAPPDLASVAPVWHREAGAPFVDQVRISVPDDCGDSVSCEIPNEFFRAAVEKRAESLVQSGALAVGERFTFRVCAFASPNSVPVLAVDLDDLEGEALNSELVIQARPIDLFRAAGQMCGVQSATENEVPVFIPARVIDEFKALSIASPEVETGVILVGHLCRDPESSELFLEVTAGIPARHTIAARASLTFTPETWAAVAAAIRLRNGGEIIVGWAHSHPWFCRNCDDESQRVCPLGKPMFSVSDRNLHETVFSLGYQVALLLSLYGDETEPGCDLFGWILGGIEARGFYVF